MDLSDSEQEQLVNLLNVVLADELVLNAKTRNYNWNVGGNSIQDLHGVFGDQRRLIVSSMDKLAKRIRGLRGRAVGILGEGLKRTRLSLQLNKDAESLEMIDDLLEGHSLLAKGLERDIDLHSDLLLRSRTLDFLGELLEQHREMATTLAAIRRGRLHLQQSRS